MTIHLEVLPVEVLHVACMCGSVLTFAGVVLMGTLAALFDAKRRQTNHHIQLTEKCCHHK